MRSVLIAGILSFSQLAAAAPWEFGQPVEVSGAAREGVYVHLESAGRKSIAVSGGWVAVTWEDNRDGQSRAYVAIKAPGQPKFSKPILISGKGEAAEPAVAGLGSGRFVAGWEEDGRVRLRIISSSGLGKSLQISDKEAAQVSLASIHADGVFAVWSENTGNFWQIRHARFQSGKKHTLSPAGAGEVASSDKGDQSYPSVAVLDGGQQVFVGWEDRSAGHTRMKTSISRDGGMTFSLPEDLNEYLWRGETYNYGKGTGAMRVALSAMGKEGAVAVWADKRDFPSGYDVYAALADAKDMKFGRNEKVQDDFGNNIAQWHPAVAADQNGHLVSVWDDDRDGNPDVWLAWRNRDGSWSENIAVPGASGVGVQSDPAIVLDGKGNLHLVWVEKPDMNNPSMVRYIIGRKK